MEEGGCRSESERGHGTRLSGFVGNLARRLEGLICAEFGRICEVADRCFPENAAQCVQVADALALWLGDGSPVNLVAGLGMQGPVRMGDLERLENFYHERGADAVLSLCPFADHSVLAGLGRRGCGRGWPLSASPMETSLNEVTRSSA